MSTSTAESPPTVGAVDVQFVGNVLTVILSDARTVTVDLERVPWLAWLLRATPEQRASFEIEAPGGFAVYWAELDDGIEVGHLLMPGPLQ